MRYPKTLLPISALSILQLGCQGPAEKDAPADDGAVTATGGAGGSVAGGSSNPSTTGAGGAGADGSVTGGSSASGGTGGTASTCPPGKGDCEQPGVCNTLLDYDEDHCGSCGHGCDTGDTCEFGFCAEELLDAYVCGVAKDSSHLYFALEDGPVTLYRVPVGGGALAPLAELPGCEQLAIDGANVYMAVEKPAGVEVYRVPKSGGTPTLTGSDAAGSLVGNVDLGVTADGAMVYWIGANGIYRAPVGGSGPVEYWVKTLCVTHVAVDGGIVYWSCRYGDDMYKRATSAGPEMDYQYEYVGQAPAAADFVTDATHLFFKSHPNFPAEGAIVLALAKTGGAPTNLLLQPTGYVNSVDVQGADVYIASDPSGLPNSVLRVPKSGGPAVAVGSLGGLIITDGSYLYGTTSSGFSRVALP